MKNYVLIQEQRLWHLQPDICNNTNNQFFIIRSKPQRPVESTSRKIVAPNSLARRSIFPCPIPPERDAAAEELGLSDEERKRKTHEVP